jgi:two-component system chemotaxis response regulator CheB
LRETATVKKIRILVVDDSAYHRRTLVKIIDSDPEMEVIDTARDGEEAIKKVVNLKPDLVTLDLEMPRMDGFTFLRWLMRNQPRPVLVVTSRDSNRSVFKALELGAVDFVIKPVKRAAVELGDVADSVLRKIREISKLKVEDLPAKLTAMAEARTPVPISAPSSGKFSLVAIGASTGGPPALQSILSSLPRGLPVGIVISQHMPEGFTRLFSERLNRTVGIRVNEAAEGEEIENGKALVAPGGKHLLLRGEKDGRVTVRLVRARPEDRYAPSIDMMMDSVAGIYGKRMIGVLLTGMGDDGALGMKSVKEGRGLTIAEAEETCIVFGMPREAIKKGVVDRVLPLPDIGNMIVSECTGG